MENAIFNSVEELCEYLEAHQHEGTLFFENPSFVKAITGITYGGQLIYDYNLMVESAMEDEGWEYEDAVDWIEYNTLRSIPYMENGVRPIISFPINW